MSCTMGLYLLIASVVTVGAPRPAPVQAETLLHCVCSSAANSSACQDRRRADIVQTTTTVLALGAPPIVSAILLSTMCGESGAKAHPRGSNDGGTSAGWYQFKKRGGHAKVFRQVHGRTLDFHDLGEASRWYIARMRNSRRIVRDLCGKVPDPWAVAAGRVAKGVWSVPPVPSVCVWAMDAAESLERQACMPIHHCTLGIPGIPRCSPRGYGIRARRWLKSWRGAR